MGRGPCLRGRLSWVVERARSLDDEALQVARAVAAWCELCCRTVTRTEVPDRSTPRGPSPGLLPVRAQCTCGVRRRGSGGSAPALGREPGPSLSPRVQHPGRRPHLAFLKRCSLSQVREGSVGFCLSQAAQEQTGHSPGQWEGGVPQAGRECVSCSLREWRRGQTDNHNGLSV